MENLAFEDLLTTQRIKKQRGILDITFDKETKINVNETEELRLLLEEAKKKIKEKEQEVEKHKKKIKEMEKLILQKSILKAGIGEEIKELAEKLLSIKITTKQLTRDIALFSPILEEVYEIGLQEEVIDVYKDLIYLMNCIIAEMQTSISFVKNKKVHKEWKKELKKVNSFCEQVCKEL